jgi:hypothetical protein
LTRQRRYWQAKERGHGLINESMLVYNDIEDEVKKKKIYEAPEHLGAYP